MRSSPSADEVRFLIAFCAKTLLIPEFQVFHQILQITIFFVQKTEKMFKFEDKFILHQTYEFCKGKNPKSGILST